MSTFVVRFVGNTTEFFRGKVRHVGTGEEAVFSSASELVAFIEGMNVVSGLGGTEGEHPDSSSSSKAGPITAGRVDAQPGRRTADESHQDGGK
jgi:hypothetical protein